MPNVDPKKMLFEGVYRKPATMWPIAGTGEHLDRTKYVTASEIGKCERQVFFDKKALMESGHSPETGTSYDKNTKWGFFERGHNIEAWAVENLLRGANGERLLYTGNGQRSFVAGSQSGTPDGVFLTTGNEFELLEIKSFDPRSNKNKFPKIPHVDQCIQNMDLVSEVLNLTPTIAHVMYINASDYYDNVTYTVEYDDNEAMGLMHRAERIMAATSAEELEPEGLFPGRYAGSCQYCAHTAACSELIRAQNKTGDTTNGKLTDAKGKFFG